MDRRAFLGAVGTGVAAGASGCIGGVRVLSDVQTTERIPPMEFFHEQLPAVDGSSAVEFTVRADRPFSVLYFLEDADYRAYRAHLNGDTTGRKPDGHDRLSRRAVSRDDTDEYEVAVPAEGRRADVSATGHHHFVVDYTDYTAALPVTPTDPPLTAAIDLTLVDKQLPL